MQADGSSTEESSEASAGDHISPLHYKIRVKGHLDPRWSAWFNGRSLTKGSDGTTVLHGPVVDQAALHGLLQKLRDLGLPLVSITPVILDTGWRTRHRPSRAPKPRRNRLCNRRGHRREDVKEIHMRAIICQGYGPPQDVLHLADVDEPAAADDEVLVRVHATSINAADWHFIRGVPSIARLQFGLRKPRFGVPGCDVAGRVEAVGKDVSTFHRDDEVFASSFMHGFGTFADRVAVPQSLVARKPSNLTFEQAAAVPLAASTALQGLRDHGHLEAGHSVLIVGASGGVGTFAVQIAKALGAEVTGVCSTSHTDMVRSLGADRVIDYTKVDFTDGNRRYDLILQAAGAQSATACRRALTTKGTLVQISGTSDNRWIGPVDRIVTGRLLSPLVSQTITSFTVQPNRRDLELIGTLIEAGKVSPVIDRTYPITDIGDAIRHVEAGHTGGKVVITVSAETPSV